MGKQPETIPKEPQKGSFQLAASDASYANVNIYCAAAGEEQPQAS